LLAQGAQSVLCTLGSQGAMYVSHHLCQHFPLPPECRDVQVVDTVGAGDCFAGSLVFFLACGLPIELAISRANRVAAVSVTKKGTQSSYPYAYQLPTELFDGCLLYNSSR
jgi:ribokinase